MIVVIGKSGQLAQELKATSANKQVIFLGREDINLFDEDALTLKLNKYKPKVIINASAYTAVDKAESDEQAAFKLNCDAVASLAEYCSENNVRFIHVSTDFVFDGKKETPYEVNDKTSPVSVYGASKLAGECAIQELMDSEYAIVRTSWLYSTYGNNFVKTMLRLMAERDELGVVADQIGCPTYARGLAEFIWNLAEVSEVSPIYNWSDLGAASWYDFAVEIYNQAMKLGLLSKEVKISPISTSDYPTPATRPSFSLLKADSASSLEWQFNLKNMLEELKSM
ncbi:dTDP-4-dehydrorhamnose reductase [Pseudoalteromonas sp. T1lg75]|uniref:dTDP-4-dehydrorhamnose reductase n=1 Tax=Pseudoalteromonas sp. T1lg75 TaxID=2077102 RepID=UPI000CF6F2D6|nr:dTDP-4-dehydrorhamnose reductase [Pseudoalteromonas sp. T1lg75]